MAALAVRSSASSRRAGRRSDRKKSLVITLAASATASFSGGFRFRTRSRQRSLWAKALLASFQQAVPCPPPAKGPLPPPGSCRLILGRVCRTFRRAHGRWCSQKLIPRRGGLLLSGAQPIADSLTPPRTQKSIPLKHHPHSTSKPGPRDSPSDRGPLARRHRAKAALSQLGPPQWTHPRRH
jgi:hypothetical protein